MAEASFRRAVNPEDGCGSTYEFIGQGKEKAEYWCSAFWSDRTLRGRSTIVRDAYA